MVFSEIEIIAESDKFHVSNVKLYEYLDDARRDWYKYCILLRVEAVLVHIGADFKKEIFDQDKLQIQTVLERVGNTSFTLKQTVTNQRGDDVAFAEVVLATIDREKRTKVSVPDEVRELLSGSALLNLEVVAKR
nr:thioesterase family protein [Neobacillus sp. Marseille-Q6967]